MPLVLSLVNSTSVSSISCVLFATISARPSFTAIASFLAILVSKTVPIASAGNKLVVLIQFQS